MLCMMVLDSYFTPSGLASYIQLEDGYVTQITIPTESPVDCLTFSNEC